MGNSEAKPVPEEESKYVKQILEAREKLTGWERVKLIFSTEDELGGWSPELERIFHTMCFSMVVGGLFGAIGRGRIAHMNFIKSNAHQAFETPLTAKRKLQDTVTLGMGAGAWRIGWRVTLFTTTYMTVATVVSTYRGKMGILDQVAGAGVAGFIYKLPHGPKAQIAGGTIGSLLGLSAGILTLGITKLTGETIDSANLKYFQHMAKKESKAAAMDEKSKEKLRKIDSPLMLDPSSEEKVEFDNLTRYHDHLISLLDKDKEESKENAVKVDSSASQSETPLKSVSNSSSSSNIDKESVKTVLKT